MSDGLAFAYKYYQGGDFFEPELFCLLSDDLESGKMVGEFPLIYWIAGKLWAIFTYSEPLYKLLSFSIALLGFWGIYKLLKDVFKSTFFGLGLTLICFSSPIVLYYSGSFVTNMHSFSFALLGWYFFYFGFFKEKKYHLHYAVWTFVLAGLLKVTASANLVLLLPLIVWRIFKTNKLGLVSVLAALSCLVYWYAFFLPEFTADHQGKYTINGLWPIWEMSDQKIANAVKFFKEITFWSLQSPVFSILLPGFAIAAFFIKGKSGLFFKYMVAGYLTGFTIYILCWFGAVDSHDYYFTNLLIMPFFFLTTGVYFVMKRFPTFFKSIKFRILFGVFVVFSIIYGANNLRMRHCDQLVFWKGFAMAFSHDIEPGYWNWMAHNSKAKDLRGLDKYLTSIGVSEDAKLIYVSDPSFSIQPYLAKRNGYTQQYICWNPDRLQKSVDHAGDYIFISNPKDTSFAKKFIGKKIGEFGKALVFKTKR